MVWNIALGIVLGMFLLWMIPMGIALVVGGVALGLEWLGQPKSKSQNAAPVVLNVSDAGTYPEPDFTADLKGWLNWVFSYSHYGRLNRLQFIKVKIGLLFAGMVVVTLLYLAHMVVSRPLFITAIVVSIPFFIVVLARNVTSDIQRLHDFDFSGWWFMASWVVGKLPKPVGDTLGLAYMAVLLFVPGTPGSNRFGLPTAGGAASKNSKPKRR